VITEIRRNSNSVTEILCYFISIFNIKDLYCGSRLDGVVVSVLAAGPKGCGFEPGQGDGFLRAIKIRSTPYFGSL
jgi:hypothetical protein